MGRERGKEGRGEGGRGVKEGGGKEREGGGVKGGGRGRREGEREGGMEGGGEGGGGRGRGRGREGGRKGGGREGGGREGEKKQSRVTDCKKKVKEREMTRKGSQLPHLLCPTWDGDLIRFTLLIREAVITYHLLSDRTGSFPHAGKGRGREGIVLLANNESFHSGHWCEWIVDVPKIASICKYM